MVFLVYLMLEPTKAATYSSLFILLGLIKFNFTIS